MSENKRFCFAAPQLARKHETVYYIKAMAN